MTTIFDVSWFGLYHVCCKISNFSIPPRIIPNERGHVTDLTSDDMHAKSKIKNVSTGGLSLSERFIFLRKIACHQGRIQGGGQRGHGPTFDAERGGQRIFWPHLSSVFILRDDPFIYDFSLFSSTPRPDISIFVQI